MKIIRSGALTFVPASHEDPLAPGVLKKVLVTGDALFEGRVQMINWALLPIGASFRRHFHEDMEEVFIIVQGAVTAIVDEQSNKLATGDTLIVSPNEVHEMQNFGDIDVHYIVVGIAGSKQGKTVVV